MSSKLSIKNVLEPFEIYFEDKDETVTIYFNPTDPDLLIRFFEVEKRVEKKIRNIGQRKAVKNKDKAENYLSLIKETNKVIYDEVDYAFGNKISDKVFKYCSPLAIVNGKYFITTFFEAIAPVIEKNISDANEKLNEHIKEYLHD